MAKANAVSGTTWYIPEGGIVPNDAPEGVALVGPGVAIPEPEVTEIVPAKEVASSQPDTTSLRSTGKTKNG